MPASTFENAGESEKEGLDLMGTNLKLLSITGILPDKELLSSIWKYRAYIVYQILSYVLYLAVFACQVVGIYYYWGEMVITVENIAVTATLMIGYIPALFAVFNRSNIRKLIVELETNSLFCIRQIRSNKKHMKTIDDAKKTAFYLTRFTVVCLSMTIFFWTSYPLVLYVLREETGRERNVEDQRPQFQYLVFVMWLPFDVTQSYWYGLVYIIQTVTFFTTLFYLEGLLPLYLNLIIYATAQFNIVSTALIEIDELYDEDGNYVSEIPDDIFKTCAPIELATANDLNQGNIKTPEREAKSGKEVLNNDTLQSGNVKLHFTTPANTQVFTNDNDETDSAFAVLVECVKFHQSAIRFAQEVDEVAGRGLFVASLCVTVLFVTQTFQMSLVLTVKYTAGFLTSLTQLFILSWFGQDIIDKSEGVGETAYNCHWYNRSTQFTRLLLTVITRSQVPLKITLGKLLVLSLELFSMILQTSYKFYTILLNLHES